jgi:hypothetical protein
MFVLMVKPEQFHDTRTLPAKEGPSLAIFKTQEPYQQKRLVIGHQRVDEVSIAHDICCCHNDLHSGSSDGKFE